MKPTQMLKCSLPTAQSHFTPNLLLTRGNKIIKDSNKTRTGCKEISIEQGHEKGNVQHEVVF